jgi:hypothetical protein
MSNSLGLEQLGFLSGFQITYFGTLFDILSTISTSLFNEYSPHCSRWTNLQIAQRHNGIELSCLATQALSTRPLIRHKAEVTS